MTNGRNLPVVVAKRRRRPWRATVAAMLALLIVVAAWLLVGHDAPPQGVTAGERVADLQAARAALQARADGESRIGLVGAFRTASLLTDALAVRTNGERERAVASLPALSREAFAALDALDAALGDALARPGEGARHAVDEPQKRAQTALDRMAGDGRPLVLQFSPRFVPPRRAGAELALAPGPSTGSGQAPSSEADAPPAAVQGAEGRAADRLPSPVMPRYVPAFAAPGEDPPVEIEVAAVGFDESSPPVLTVGAWQEAARVTPLRLHFSVPRAAFATDPVRSTFAVGTLAFRRGARPASYQLLFVVLPDRPGQFALDQKVRTLVPESKTLVSPEILARADAGKTATVRHCFDPPAGTRFDKSQRRIVEIQRLGWHGDLGDPTLNEGTVDFAKDEKPGEICLVVTAAPADAQARTATIGRFEATLVQDRAEDNAVKTGVRALDWNEAVRVPLDPNTVEWRLYLKLLGEISREFDTPLSGDAPLPSGLPFLRLERDAAGKTLILRADPTAAP
ncbi:hypothetical protein [Enhydrobacter sp.]|jgi:hypothetical protein|uniref:hypothetical protein n=1 Tax=Enhydrobacter sp. TaxID=1894999 RepID=UPI002622EE53|nr:hypothetical protein [Enhydrobacter sp.]WIM09332.1 MAG: hypothetical protein OJF58_000283 [Enhydrobacter sp.]